MEAMTLTLLLVLSVLISAVIDRFVKNLTIPLVQICLGIAIAVFAHNTVKIEFDSELFMVLFIAPLLYIEAKHANKLELWRDRKGVLGLAIILVVLTSLAIGFSLHFLVPMVPMFSALALGAALGPTDAVAVTSVSRTTNIPKNIFSLLKGELLLNDASGIVMFQVAIAAAAAGSVNFLQVGEDFVVEFFGGLIFGLLVGFAGKYFLRKMRDSGLDSTVFHVLCEICVPFVVYMTSSAIHVSGIIAVVACGLVDPIQNTTASPAISKMNIVSESFWEVFSFVLNGVVFVLLGTQIPPAMYYVWDDASISNWFLLGCIILVAFILLFSRFLWCLVMMQSREPGDDEKELSVVKRALIMTLCGAKGTITLSILFTLPVALLNGVLMQERSLLIFIGCGVIVVTLLLATFVLPLIAPKPETTENEEAEITSYYENLQLILREVIYQLTASENDLNRRATRQVVEDYQKRLDHAKSFTDEEDEGTLCLRLRMIHWEEEKLEMIRRAGEASTDAIDTYMEFLDKNARILSHATHVILPSEKVVRFRATCRRYKRLIAKYLRKTYANMDLEVRQIKVECERYALDCLKTEMAMGAVQAEYGARIVVDYERTIASLTRPAPTITTAIKTQDATDDVRAFALKVELNKIDELQESGALSRKNAMKMRDNVALMELERAGAI